MTAMGSFSVPSVSSITFWSTAKAVSLASHDRDPLRLLGDEVPGRDLAHGKQTGLTTGASGTALRVIDGDPEAVERHGPAPSRLR